jgi:hypothetical protein
LTGATGLTFCAPAAGRRAIFAGGAAAGTSCSAPDPCWVGRPKPSSSELHAVSPSAATTPSATSSRRDRP